MLAINHRWNCLEILEGTEFVKWAVWAVATENGLNVIGFEPTDKQREKAKNIEYIIRDFYKYESALADTYRPCMFKSFSDSDDVFDDDHDSISAIEQAKFEATSISEEFPHDEITEKESEITEKLESDDVPEVEKQQLEQELEQIQSGEPQTITSDGNSKTQKKENSNAADDKQ